MARSVFGNRFGAALALYDRALCVTCNLSKKTHRRRASHARAHEPLQSFSFRSSQQARPRATWAAPPSATVGSVFFCFLFFCRLCVCFKRTMTNNQNQTKNNNIKTKVSLLTSLAMSVSVPVLAICAHDCIDTTSENQFFSFVFTSARKACNKSENKRV